MQMITACPVPRFLKWAAVWCRYRAAGRRDATWLAEAAVSGYFDGRYYLDRYQDVAASGMDPLIHFFDFGAAELRRPSGHFDTAFYRESNPSAAAAGMNPLVHFLRCGRKKNYPTVPPLPFYRHPLPINSRIASPAPVSIYEEPPNSLTQGRSRYVVYTAVIAGYDDLVPPARQADECDFVVFSDQPIRREGWITRHVTDHHADPARSSRFIKLHPHLYFPEYEHSIWIDANIGIIGDIGRFIDTLGNGVVGAFRHPLRQCIYEEGVECIERRKDSPHIITRQLQRYRDQGVEENIGLWETNILVRRHNDARCIRLMTSWWNEIQAGSRRDQLSLPVVRARQAIDIVPLDRLGVSALAHPLVWMTSHRLAPPDV